MNLNMTDWELKLDEDAVLRGQGADPAIIRQRSPRLVQMATRALEDGRPLLRPQVHFAYHEVESIRHERVTLTGGGFLSGAMIAQHLGPAQQIIILVCTIGEALDDLIDEVTNQEMVYALALDGVGSAAVEALANEACRHLEDEAAQDGFQASIPLSPGMIGWSVDQGQPQIFTLIDGEEIGVTLNDYYVMAPRKSLSMVLGLGPDMGYQGKVCDFCAMRDTCRYQDHYDPTEL
jgi:hypothetical protein